MMWSRPAAVSLAVLAAVGLGAGATPLADASTVLTPSASAAAAHGGGVPRPASWPKTVPVPAGKIQASLTLPGRWILTITAEGTMTGVRARVIQLYTSHGFVRKPQPTTRSLFQNRGYTVFADLYSNDHNPRSTNMRLEVDKRK